MAEIKCCTQKTEKRQEINKGISEKNYISAIAKETYFQVRVNNIELSTKYEGVTPNG